MIFKICLQVQDNLFIMEWQFRKILDSIESYRIGSPKFMAQIQRGAPGVLKTIVREIQLIISDPNAKILSKVLAMRFARDIMITGRQDVINELTRLVPHMMKVCSYRIQSEDLNRGQTFFSDHPQYRNGSPQERQEIEKYGSTYFILNLQSIYHWGNWIKVDDLGNESVYSKSLNTLIERGVKFHNNFNYYKNSDTQKFKNTYRIQFFSEESSELQSNLQSSNFRSEKSSYNGENVRQIDSVPKLLSSLQALKNSNSKRFDKLEILNKNAVNLLEKKYPSNILYYGKDKADKRWLEGFIVNYNLLEGNKISYDQFMKRTNFQNIQIIPEKTQIQSPSQKGDSVFKKQKSSAKRQILSKGYNDDKITYEQLMRKQQQSYQQLKQKFRNEIGELNQKIEREKSVHQQEKNNIIQSYQQRIRSLKLQVGANNSNRNQLIIKQNEKLKEKLLNMERSLQASRCRQIETDNIVAAYDQLKVEHHNLKRQRNDDFVSLNQKGALIVKIKDLQKQLQNQKNNSQVLLTKIPAETELIKKSKQIQTLNDELNIYKSSIKSQREEFERKIRQLKSKLQDSEQQIKNLKQKNKNLQKKIDLRDVESVQLQQQIKLYKTLGKQEFRSRQGTQRDIYDNKNSQTMENAFPVTSVSKPFNTLTKLERPLYNYDFKKYQALRNQIFSTEKELFLRFCRCCLKKKDLLLKQNGFEIGIISQTLSNNEVKYILHLTNTSEHQLNQIKIHCECPSTGESQVSLKTEYIFCLQPNEQEKVILFCRSSNFFMSQSYYPIFLIIKYIKNSKIYETKVVIPFVLYKTMQTYKIDRQIPNMNNQYSLTFPYSHKLLPQTKYLTSYFPNIEETSKDKFQCDILNRQTNSLFRLGISKKQDNKLEVLLSPIGQSRVTPREQQLIEQDLLGLLQFCFRKM